MPVPIQISPRPRAEAYKPSHFNLLADTPTGDVVVINTLSGSHVLFPSAYRDVARQLLAQDRIDADESNGNLIRQLVSVGIVVPMESNERRQLRYLQAHQTSTSKSLQLIVFPTEKCNFRCVYCYEDFVRKDVERASVGFG